MADSCSTSAIPLDPSALEHAFDVGPDKKKVGMACSDHTLCVQLEMFYLQGSCTYPCWQIQQIFRPSTILASQKLNFIGILCEHLPADHAPTLRNLFSESSFRHRFIFNSTADDALIF